MFDVNKAIYACDDVICRNIESFTTEQRGCRGGSRYIAEAVPFLAP